MYLSKLLCVFVKIALCICQNCTNPLLAGDGGKPEIVLAEVDADGGGEATVVNLLGISIVVFVVLILGIVTRQSFR